MDKEMIFRNLLLRLDGEIVEDNDDHRRLMQMAGAKGLSPAHLASKKFLDICSVMIHKGKLSAENLDFLIDIFPETENSRAYKDICDTRVILTGEDIIAATEKVESKDWLIRGKIYIAELQHQERVISILNELLNRAKKKKSLSKALKSVDRIDRRIEKAYVKMRKLNSTLERMGITYHIKAGSIQILFDYDSKTSILRLQKIYHSGELQQLLQDGLITKYVLEECGMESMRLEISIAEEEFARCLAIAGDDAISSKVHKESKDWLIRGKIYIAELQHQEQVISILNELLYRAKEKKSFSQALKSLAKINKKIEKAFEKMRKLSSTLESMGIMFHITTGSFEVVFYYNSTKSLLRLQDIYHSGELQQLLQDGLITKYVLKECGMESMSLGIYIAEEEFVKCLAIAGMGNRMEEDKTDSAGGKAVDDPETQEVEDAEEKTGVTLTKKEQKLLDDIFAAGTEKHYFVRINFVGFTGAGKTSIMLQMFLQTFYPSKTTSTDGIDICLGYCIIDLATGKWKQYDKKEKDELLERIKAITATEGEQEPNDKTPEPKGRLQGTTLEEKKIRKSGETRETSKRSDEQHTIRKIDEEPKLEFQSILEGTINSNPEQERIISSSAAEEKLEEIDKKQRETNVDRELKDDSQSIHLESKSNFEQATLRKSSETGGIFDESNQHHSGTEVDEDLDGALKPVEIIYDRNSSKQTEIYHGQDRNSSKQTEIHQDIVDNHLTVRIQQATETSGRKHEMAFVNGFDYAGPATYYSLHQLFFSKRGINLIVLDASRDLDDPINDEDALHIGGHLTGNSKDFFRYSSKLLRYFLPQSNTTKIITVFTHKDLVRDQNELQDKKYDIQDLVAEMGMNEMFYKDIFCVNANDPKDKDLHQLRHVILDLSKAADDWGKRMPSRWLLLEDKLMTKKSQGVRVMTLAEVEELNEGSSPRLESRDELLLFLKVHHDIGTLIHFADEGLHNVVILDAQWLVDSFKTIISAKQFKDHIHRREWKRLHDKSIVDKEFMLKVWRNHEEERFFDFKDELILLMNTMDLIASPRKYNDEGQHVSTPYCVVPCMLQKAPSDFLAKYQKNARHSNNALSFEFEHSFLPTATVYRLLATCIMQYGDTEKSKKPNTTVYCNAAVFKVYRHHFLTLEITSSSIIANIVVIGKTPVDVGVSQGVKEFLDDTLKYIIAAQKTTTKYEISVACGNVGKDGTSWLKLKDLLETPSFVCDYHENDPAHDVDSDEILKHWLVTKITRTEPQTGVPRIQDKSNLDDKPSHNLLGRISRRIPRKDIHLLFLSLGLSEDFINTVDQGRKDTLLLLFEWLEKPNATIQVLTSALKEQQGYILDIKEIQSTSYDWRADYPSDRLDKNLSDATDADKDTVCQMTGARYLQLGLELGFIKEDVDVFVEDYKKCHSITRKIIKSWIQKQTKGATWKVLGDALYEIGANPEFIKDICNTTEVSKKACAIA